MSSQYLTGFRVLDVMKTGSSRPVIVEDKKGDKYLVKLKFTKQIFLICRFSMYFCSTLTERFIIPTLLKHLNLSELIGLLPHNWVSGTKNLAQILEQDIHKAIHNKDIYCEIMDKLSFITIETEETRKKRVLENRKKFEIRFKHPPQ